MSIAIVDCILNYMCFNKGIQNSILNRHKNKFRDSFMSRSAFYSWIARFLDSRNDVQYG